jgi:hypothetical protein
MDRDSPVADLPPAAKSRRPRRRLVEGRSRWIEPTTAGSRKLRCKLRKLRRRSSHRRRIEDLLLLCLCAVDLLCAGPYSCSASMLWTSSCAGSYSSAPAWGGMTGEEGSRGGEGRHGDGGRQGRQLDQRDEGEERHTQD